VAEPERDNPADDIRDAAQQAVAAETTPAPVQHRLSVRFEVALLLLIAAFAGLTLLVATTSTQGIDLLVTRTVQAVASPLMGSLMAAISWPGYSPQAIVIAALIVLLLYGVGLRWEAVAALATGLLEEALDLVVKDAIRRARPAADLVHVVLRLKSYGFPSGHVTFYTAFFGFLFFLAFTLLRPSWKRTLLLVIFGGLILLIGVSRVYRGEHWASDVVGAYLLGSLALIASIQFYRWGKGRLLVRQPVASEKHRA
jgi:membrane-associated phospholipid phosphatase